VLAAAAAAAVAGSVVGNGDSPFPQHPLACHTCTHLVLAAAAAVAGSVRGTCSWGMLGADSTMAAPGCSWQRKASGGMLTETCMRQAGPGENEAH
jgi:hypothetical protein